MTAAALALVGVAALLHATWNLFTKRSADPFSFLWTSMLLASLGLAPAAVWFLARDGFALEALPFVAATAAIHAWYFYALAQAYRFGEFSRVYPIARGLGVGLVPLLAWPVLGELPSALGWVGVALVVGGMALLGSGGAQPLGVGSGWALATGLSISAYSLVDKAGVARLHPIPYVTLLGLGSTLILAPIMLRRRAAIAAEWRASWRTILLAALLNLTTYALVLFAFRLAKTGYVVAARELSIVLSVAAGSLWLGEAPERRRWVGAAVILAGVVCVSLAR